MVAKKKIRVSLSPALLKEHYLEDSVVVIIDILRATTSMCVALDFGAEAIIPVETIDECYVYKQKGYLVAAERNAIPVEGFDFGNSPFSFMNPTLKGKTLVMSTTNGTRALHSAKAAKQIVIGAFSNQTLLTDYLRSLNENIVFLCSGWKYEINIEDTIFAGAVINELFGIFDIGNDAAFLAMHLYAEADRRKRFFMQSSTHFKRLIEMDLQADVKYSLRRDSHSVIPVYDKNEGKIVKIDYEPKYVCLLKK